MDKRFPLEDQIEMLASSLRGRVVTAQREDYDALRTVSIANWDHYRPAAIIRAANAVDVAATVNFANATGLELAVRSGGHSTVGHSSSAGGLVIDLRDIDGIEIDAVAKTAWIGAGQTAGAVSAALDKQGLILGFGDAASVGVGGLTLGGGIGYMVRKYGLTADNLLAAELVTADGEIIIADAQTHSELFWALRGGGGNFGIVTRFKFKLHAMPSFIGGPLVLPATAEVLAGFAAAADRAPDELSTIALVMPMPPFPFVPPAMHGKLVIMGMMAFCGAPEDADNVLAPFRALATPLADLVGPAPYSSMYPPEEPFRPAVSVRTKFVDSLSVADAGRIIEELDRLEAPMKMAQIRVLGGAFGRVAADATAFAHRQSRIMTAFLAFYAPQMDAAGFERWAEDCIAMLPGGDRGAYVNFLANEGPERVRAAYPGATWERLRAIKTQYDPDNLFRLNQNIPPA